MAYLSDNSCNQLLIIKFRSHLINKIHIFFSNELSKIFSDKKGIN
jgi:hypothetical protein